MLDEVEERAAGRPGQGLKNQRGKESNANNDCMQIAVCKISEKLISIAGANRMRLIPVPMVILSHQNRLILAQPANAATVTTLREVHVHDDGPDAR